MRLILAELRKLNRPLTWGVAAAVALFCVLLAIGGASNTNKNQRSAARPESTLQVAAQLHPLGAGAEAAGLMASMPGALALALMAGGHVGGEWSGRTMKQLLTQEGRRTRVIAAKLISLWVAGIGMIAVSWIALAIAGPVISHAASLPPNAMSATDALEWSASQSGRALLVVAVFASIGLLAAVLTRNTIGTMAGAAGAVLAMLVAASLPSLGSATPATWVQGWMGFAAGTRSISTLPNNFWSRFIDSSGAAPGHAAGGFALVVLVGVCVATAALIFRRTDVVG